jgi:hypothetical protein
MKNRFCVGKLIFFLLLVVACNAQGVVAPGGEVTSEEASPIQSSVTVTPARTETTNTPVVTGPEAQIAATGAIEATLAGEEPALSWQAEIETEEGPQAVCRQLLLAANNQARIGPCGAADTPVTLLAHQEKDWSDILDRFAPFQADTSQGMVSFRGTGEVSGPAWERAVAAWARFTYQELQAGRVGASLKTDMSWWLGEVPDQPGYCKHLLVLTFGYAYATVEPCQGGGPPLNHTEGWLDTDRWQQFDAWLYRYAPVYQENNYFAGKDNQEMPEGEVERLQTWAEAIYAELTGS